MAAATKKVATDRAATVRERAIRGNHVQNVATDNKKRTGQEPCAYSRGSNMDPYNLLPFADRYAGEAQPRRCAKTSKEVRTTPRP